MRAEYRPERSWLRRAARHSPPRSRRSEIRGCRATRRSRAEPPDSRPGSSWFRSCLLPAPVFDRVHRTLVYELVEPGRRVQLVFDRTQCKALDSFQQLGHGGVESFPTEIGI